MNGLIRASLGNPYAVTVMSLTLIVLGGLSITLIPIDILPVFKSPAVQTLTFYNGMSATSIAHDITNRMERWTGQANGMLRGRSRGRFSGPASSATTFKAMSIPTARSPR